MKQAGSRRKAIHILDLIIGIILLIFLVLILMPGITEGARIASGASFVFFTAVYIGMLAKMGAETDQYEDEAERIEPGYLHISMVVLINDEGKQIKEWQINGKVGLVIGKSIGETEVDIDLSDAASAPLISREHAVLNYSGGFWYIEDADSENGTTIQKVGGRNYVLTEKSPYRLERGDVVYISDTPLRLQ